MTAETVQVLDVQNRNKIYDVAKKTAYRWVTQYPYRFKLVDPNQTFTAETDADCINQEKSEQESDMPTGIPKGFEPMTDGVHVVKVIEVESNVQSKFGLQEVAKCSCDGNDGPDDLLYNIYFPHNSKKAYDAGVQAGAIAVKGEEWNIVLHSEFRVLVQSGKVVTLFKL